MNALKKEWSVELLKDEKDAAFARRQNLCKMIQAPIQLISNSVDSVLSEWMVCND
jgi:hypothetical protein